MERVKKEFYSPLMIAVPDQVHATQVRKDILPHTIRTPRTSVHFRSSLQKTDAPQLFEVFDTYALVVLSAIADLPSSFTGKIVIQPPHKSCTHLFVKKLFSFWFAGVTFRAT